MLCSASETQSKVSSKKKSRYHSKRKIKPSGLQFGSQDLINKQTACCGYLKNSKQMQEEIRNQHKFIYNEYFVANCDQSFFKSQEMNSIIYSLFSKQDSKSILKYSQYKLIHQILPKTKLFSSQFLKKQKKKLNENRIFSQGQKYKSSTSILGEDSNRIQIKSSVWAFNLFCSHLHAGTVISIKHIQNAYMIQFDDQNLGVSKIPSYLVSNIFPSRQLFSKFYEIKVSKSTELQQSQMDAFGILLSFLNLKQKFIEKLRQYHDMIQIRQKNEELLSQIQIQQYGWIGTILGLINIAIKYLNVNMQCFEQIAHKEHGKNQKLPYLKLSDSYVSSGTNFSQESEQKRQQIIKIHQQKLNFQKSLLLNKDSDLFAKIQEALINYMNQSNFEAKQKETILTNIKILIRKSADKENLPLKKTIFFHQFKEGFSDKYKQHFHKICQLIEQFFP